MSATDFHNHLIPGVDDGARTLEESLQAMAALHQEGVRSVCVTPHVRGSLTADPAALAARRDELDRGWETLCRGMSGEALEMTLTRGAELMLDVPEPDLSDGWLRLAGTRAALVEFPFMTVPPHSDRVLNGLRRQGWAPVLAHPERYVGADGELAARWRDSGAYLQVNAGSLLGRYGTKAQELATALLERGLVDYLASDYHARGTPLLRECAGRLREWDGEESLALLTETNPARLLRGDFPLPVPPVRIRRGLLRHVKRALGLGSRRRS